MSFTKMNRNTAAHFECSPSCHSRQHGAQITAAIIRGTEAQCIAYMKNTCQKCHMITDASGKNPLHTAASCGKKKVVKWLLSKGAPFNQRDLESGYTPLHRALFYGQVHVAVALIQAGANLNTLDHDALTPLDHIHFDRPPYVSFSFSLPKHVYVWGSNDNYNLGQPDQRGRETPDFLDFFHREGHIVTDVILNKFHTVFLTSSGRVYTCGLGHGGRLGINVSTPVVTPSQIRSLSQNNIVKVAAGPDHSLFLTDSGQVWACGSNTYHQLGLNPPPESVYSPRILSWHKTHKDEAIVGIRAAKYHSVIWTSKVLYTFGLNAGQLGHFKNDNELTVVNPRSVTSIVVRDEGTLACIGVSDGATVVSTSFGDIYVLHQYQTRKVASKMIGIVKIACIGGHLDSRIGAEGLKSQGGASLKIAVLIGGGVGHLYLWTEDNAHLSRCLFSINRKIILVDFCISVNSLVFVTDDGEAFSAIALPPRKRKAADKGLAKTWGPSGKFNEFVDRNSCIMLRLSRIAGLHRTVTIVCDPKGRNFAALQNEPNSFLLDLPQVSVSAMDLEFLNFFQAADEADSIHDVIIKCGHRKFPAHSYILAHHSSYFRELLLKEEEKCSSKDSATDFQMMSGNLQNTEEKCFTVPNVNPEIMQEILTYIYSGSCQLTTYPCQFKMLSYEDDIINGSHIDGSKDEIPVNRDVNLQGKAPGKKKKKGHKNTESKSNNKLSSSQRPLEVNRTDSHKKPIHLLQSAARTLGIPALVKKIDNLEMVDGYMQLKAVWSESDGKAYQHHHYTREDHEDLWDVMIESKSGDILGAHKCVLAARLEYFNCMFSASWREAVSSKPLSIPIPTGILALLLDYLYEDDAPKLYYCKDIEFLCSVLIIADQFLVARLCEICEVAISRLLTLKNAGEVLTFSSNYNAHQLKNTAMEFISLNLAAMLENGSLLRLSSDVLADLSKYYRKFIPRMSCRLLTPFDQPPYAEELEKLLEDRPLTLPESEDEWDEDVCSAKGDKQQSSVRKKRRSRYNSQGESRSRKTSTSSVVSFSSSDGDAIKNLEEDLETLDFNDLEERNPNETPEKRRVTERNTSESELILPLKENMEIKSYNPNFLDMGSWQKVGKKKSISGQSLHSDLTDTPRESPVRENGIEDGIAKASPQNINGTGLPRNVSSVPFDNVGNAFPSLADSFIRSPVPVVQTKSGKISKLSQKERKRIATAVAAEVKTSALSDETSNEKILSKSTSWAKPRFAWGSKDNTVNDVEVSVRSQTLVDIMKTEEASAKSRQGSSPINMQVHKKSCEAQGSFTSSRKSFSFSDSPLVRQSSRDHIGGGAWSNLASSLPAEIMNKSLHSPGSPSSLVKSADTPSFSKILQEEEIIMDNLIKERSKPLSLIQLEDRAIEELLGFYGANECCDENITVSRVKLAMANPQWKKA
ncbi:hypothetical protein SK128_012683 [Halocaridina rubra]|uniref:BTB domain-containing protein n=1 Tax=Halocaridina rubra TaxID=373956 RepID=A0AAN8XTU8_HALRR